MTTSKAKNRLTKQREVILEVVKAACYHPTAEQIFHLTRKLLPKISVGTVYRNLDVLTGLNLIKKIDIPGEPARFDAELTNKAYFVCKEKGAIYDLDIDPKKIRKLFGDNAIVNSIDDFSILIFGTTNNIPEELSMRKGQINN